MTAPAEVIELTYPDGPKDAETLLVDPLNGDICVITKREILSRVYFAPKHKLVNGKYTMKHVATLGRPFAVGGDVSANGKLVIVRTPRNASVWQRPAGRELWLAFLEKESKVKLKKERQGEAISFDHLGRGYYTVSEKKNSPIYYFQRIDAPRGKGQ
jgi:hypothetical protein